MKNVLVSRDKWESLIKYLEDATWVDEKANIILAMPDFVESEDDVELVGKAIADEDEDAWESSEIYAQAAINALKIKGE
jgi:hypothetical protein